MSHDVDPGLVVLAFVIGGLLGWFAGRVFEALRTAHIQQQLDAKDEQLQVSRARYRTLKLVKGGKP